MRGKQIIWPLPSEKMKITLSLVKGQKYSLHFMKNSKSKHSYSISIRLKIIKNILTFIFLMLYVHHMHTAKHCFLYFVRQNYLLRIWQSYLLSSGVLHSCQLKDSSCQGYGDGQN